MSKPRGRLENNSEFEMRELGGQTIENLVAYRCEGEEPHRVSIVGLLLQGAPYWHRFFLDAGIGFWEEWTAEGAFEDFADCHRLELASRWHLSGARILEAVCESDPGLSRFRWRLDRRLLSLEYARADSESETVLRFEEAAESA